MTKDASFTGVNIGGWLILERWQTPSVFEGVDAQDEWSLSQTPTGRSRIKHHRRTFITEADFKWLQEHNVSVVRLPVPYWAVIETDDYVSAQTEVDWAMKMAEKYGLKVLLDLHAVPGGQNAGDHSGRKNQIEWFDSKVHQDQTMEILKTLAHRYKDSPALWGIEIMNEPNVKGHYWQLVRFYRRAYNELRKVIRPGIYTVFHDGFMPLLFAGSLWPRRNYPVIMDVHWYGFALDSVKTLPNYLFYSRLLRSAMVRIVQLWQPVIIGEWSSVLPQRFFDARPQTEHMALLQQNIAMQIHAYRPAKGSMYWNYTAEGEGMWNFKWLVENEVINIDL